MSTEAKNPVHRTEAIHQFCKSCIYDPEPGNGAWRQQTEACTSTNCALYAFRPMSKLRQEPSGNPEPKALKEARITRAESTI